MHESFQLQYKIVVYTSDKSNNHTLGSTTTYHLPIITIILAGASVIKGKAQDKTIQAKIDDLTRAVERLEHLQAHDALVILKNSLAIPKLLYLLRTSQCSDNPLLRQFDDTLRTGLISSPF